MSDWDVIVIGSGAGGGTLVHQLAPSGKRILLLERGDWLPREPQNWLAQDVFADGRYNSPDSWEDGDGKSFAPQAHYFVGGATKMFGAALYRLRAEDFGEIRHADGVSPAWPISYEEMEPHYTQGGAALPGPRRQGGGSDRAAGQRAIPVSRRRLTSRGSRSSPTTSPPPAISPSMPRAACCSTSRTCRTAAACVARTATAFPASCTPSPTPR